MAPAILTISGSGGIIPTGTIDINFTSYASADVDVQILMLMGMKVRLLVMEF